MCLNDSSLLWTFSQFFYINSLYLVRTGFSKIEPVTCKILIFLPKNTGIKLKTMHARGIYEKVGQVTQKYTLRYNKKVLLTAKLLTCNFVRIRLNVNRLNSCSKFITNVENFCCQTCNIIFQWVHQHAQFRGYLITLYMRVLLFMKWLNHMLIINIPHVLFFYEHAILLSTGLTACSKFTMNVEYFCYQTSNLIFHWVH